MNISYEEIGQVLVTCPAEKSVVRGQVVKMGANGLVAPCANGERICGLAVSVAEDGCAAVQMRGFAQIPCTDSGVKPGFVKLVSNGTGGLRKASSEGACTEALVMSNDGESIAVCL